MHNALLHWEPLLVVAARDLEDVACELGPNAVTGDFLAHAAVHEDAEFALIFDFDELLCAVGGVGDVELHLGGGDDTPRWTVVERWLLMLSVEVKFWCFETWNWW